MATPAPPPEAPAPRPRGLLGRLFSPVQVPPDAAAELAALAARGSLVVVMRSSGLLSYLYLKWLLRRLGLPPLRAAQGFTGLAGALARVRRSRRALEEAVAAGHASVVFLNQPGRTSDPFQHLARLQRSLARPVFLVPALLAYSRRAQRLRPSIWDVLYGSPEAPSAFANAVGFLRNFRRTFLALGRPLDLVAFGAARPEMDDAALGRTARGALAQQLARQLRTAVGPPLKTAARVREKVLRDRTLRGALDGLAREGGRTPAALAAEAERCFEEIASRYDPGFISLMRPILAVLFRKLYESVEVDEAGLAEVKKAAADAPLVFCPSHKSYVDFLVLSWLLYERGMTPPHVAAGLNLSFWPFGALARRGGAFFIRRTVKGDRVYTAVLRAYVKHLLRDRFPQEFYVEGGRSRTGKLLFPKMGLVSMEVDAWLDGAAADVLFVPVAVDYERLIEASAYVRELAGGEKKQESLSGLLGAFGVLFRSYERLYVQFDAPVSLRAVAEQRLGARAAALVPDAAWAGEAAARHPATLPGPGAAAEDPATAKRQLVQAVANRIAWGISRAVTITPVGLVAAALLSHVKRGLTAGEVTRRVELLRYIAAEGGARFGRDLAGASSDPRQPGPVADAVARLAAGGVVRVEVAAGDHIYQVVDEKRPVLDYHRNAVIHRYVAPAIVAAALRAAGPGATAEAAQLRAAWLSRLFKLEFMYRPDARLDAIFAEHLAFLARVGAVALDGAQVRPGAEPDVLDFLAEFLRPYLEAYRVAAEAALALLGEAPRGALDRRGLVKAALERGRAAFLAGRLQTREALSKATIENAVEWLVATGQLTEAGGKLGLAQAPADLREIIDGMTPYLAS
ncbi:MAG: 1-acyl-sn-glycerol-3-phosphate acyltransferase [Anaeromyxobacter sp.]|nr:1-acyl-sn-glycerol-3-phosphate acyltransferase [Anaeromyxobacter sp.]MBL0276108.1 1-acyl-sn-glycerol-3-phosphate acyltransferase [Anaeromyxobacter sp.]